MSTTALVPGRSPLPKLRAWLMAVALLAIGALVIAQRGVITSSLRKLGHLHWFWVPVAVSLELVSLATFARMQRRLFRAGDRTPALRPVMATAYASTAISTWVPFVGPQLAAAFSFRRYRLLGIDSTLAGWVLVVSGAISTFAGALVIAAGAVLSGNRAVAIAGATGGFIAALGLLAATMALRRPRSRRILELTLDSLMRPFRRFFETRKTNPSELVAKTLDRFGALRLARSDWGRVTGLALFNWLADVGVLAASIAAVGVAVPWRGLLLAYGIMFASGGITTITPGGIGVVEAALTLALVGVGLHRPSALAAVLFYRLVNFWMVTAIGGAAYFMPRWGIHQRKFPAMLQFSGMESAQVAVQSKDAAAAQPGNSAAVPVNGPSRNARRMAGKTSIRTVSSPARTSSRDAKANR